MPICWISRYSSKNYLFQSETAKSDILRSSGRLISIGQTNTRPKNYQFILLKCHEVNNEDIRVCVQKIKTMMEQNGTNLKRYRISHKVLTSK